MGICRHFLWQINKQSNQPLTRKSIVSTITELTEYGDIDSRRIANVLSLMAKNGEIERFKGISNRVGWNPELTNQVKWSRFNSSYDGKPIRIYTEDEANAITKLLKLSNSMPFMPKDFKDLQHTTEIEENEMLRAEVIELKNEISSIKSDLEALKKLCYEKFKTSETQEWFKEHGLVVV
jgi:hypothetical protein